MLEVGQFWAIANNLDGTTADNNAFVMRIGPYLMVEFGSKGNAMYVFEWGAIGQPLLNTLTSGRARAVVGIHRLRDSNRVERLIHRDSAAQTWEQKFDACLVPRIGKRPSDPPGRPGVLRRGASLAPRSGRPPSDPPRRVEVVRRGGNNWFSMDTFLLFARMHGLEVKDNRSSQGALWVLGVEQPSHVIDTLEAWGFKSRSPKGWFKE